MLYKSIFSLFLLVSCYMQSAETVTIDGKKITLTGNKVRKEQPFVVDTIDIPSTIARVFIVDSAQPTYYTCDAALLDYAECLTVNNQRLSFADNNTSINYDSDKKDAKPLYTIYAHIYDKSLHATGSSEVSVQT